MKTASAFTTAGSSAALLILFDMLWVLVLERAQPVGYFVLSAVLVATVAGLVALVTGFLHDPPPWTTSLFCAVGAGVTWGVWSALASGLALALLLAWRPGRDGRRASPALVYGVAAATGLGFSAIVAPRLWARLSFVPIDSEFVAASMGTLALVCVTAALVPLGAALARRSSPRSAAVGIALALLSMLALPLVSEGARNRADPSEPVSEATSEPPALAQPSEAETGERPHVVLLVLDTVRADHMSLYGYERETTPQLEAFFARRSNAVALASIYANSNWTVPSHASLFTGLPPSGHGSHFGSGSQIDFSIGDHATLAEVMRRAGYKTAGFYANPWLGLVDGLERGFEVYRSPVIATRLPHFGEALRRLMLPGVYPQMIHTSPRGDAMLETVKDELVACGDQPCFVFANLIDAHSFYVADQCRGRFADWSPREEITLLSIHDSPARTARLMARYDEEICELDRHLGAFLEALESAGILDDTWVFVTSDHGEAFGDHGNMEHGTSAYNDQVWVPLLMIPPRAIRLEGATDPGSLTDVTATIAAIGGAERVGVGRDLRTNAADRPIARIEFYGDESKQADQNPRAADPARAVVVGSYKLVDQSGRLELFDRLADPAETRDLADTLPDVADQLEGLLPELIFSDRAENGDSEISPEMLEQLRELGYAH